MSPIMADVSMRASARRALSAYFARCEIMAPPGAVYSIKSPGIFNGKRCKSPTRMPTGDTRVRIGFCGANKPLLPLAFVRKGSLCLRYGCAKLP